MRHVFRRLWADERGFVVSAELVLILTIGVLGLVVGISSVASSVNNELNDVSNAFGALDQSYWYSGLVKWGHSGVSGSAFADMQDDCDCSIIVRVRPAVKSEVRPGVPFLPPPPGHIVPPAPPAFGCGPCDDARRAVAAERVAALVLSNGVAIPAAGMHAIQLADDAIVPLSAAYAVQQADGKLIIGGGGVALQLTTGETVPLHIGGTLRLTTGLMVPLASTDRRFAGNLQFSLRDAKAVNVSTAATVKFTDGTVLRIGAGPLAAGMKIRLAGGKMVTLSVIHGKPKLHQPHPAPKRKIKIKQKIRKQFQKG